MNRTRWRLMAACLAVLGAAIAVAGGSAGNRNGEGTLVAVPGPPAVTYGENIAYKATFTNLDTNNATFTQTKFVMPPPVAPDGAKATPELESCANGSFDPNTKVLTCEFGQLRPGQMVSLTVVWKAPPGLLKPGCENCFDADGTWLIKEGKQTNLNESFPVEELAALIGVNEEVPAVNGNHRAGGYELKGCATATETNLETNPSINASKNPVVTKFCLPASFLADGAAGGVATTITEPSGGPNFAKQSVVCIADVGQNCPEGTSKDFGPDKITFTFLVAGDALPSGYKITQVFHNSTTTPLPMCGTAAGDANEDGCVVSITPPKGNLKIWTIVTKSKTNGPWNW
jgi:hypothetical protein